MTQVAATAGDTAADNVAKGSGETRAPRPYILGQAPGPLGFDELAAIDRWWRAANYLSVGQIYLMANPLLSEPLQPEHIKPRLLGHFGTVPGLNLVWAHANRQIVQRDLNAVFIAGPGHGGPGQTHAHGWRAATPSCTATSPRTAPGWQRSSVSSPFPAGCRAIVLRKPPGRCTRAASWGIRCCTATALRWTTLI
jgi:xylulose-5-phosphate/fructose-6-phosphate phosphoketolase